MRISEDDLFQNIALFKQMGSVAFGGVCLGLVTGKRSQAESEKLKEMMDCSCKKSARTKADGHSGLYGPEKISFYFEGNEIYRVLSACDFSTVGFMCICTE